MRSLDEGNAIDTCFLDLMKAFDSVPHKRLLAKLHAYGIRGKLHQWIKNFLCNRTQRVIVNGSSSPSAPVKSGVPQGSVLGPTLFIIYINDMPDVVESCIRLYADDAKLYRAIKSGADEVQLQRDITSLQEWSCKWLLNFHPDKCKMM